MRPFLAFFLIGFSTFALEIFWLKKSLIVFGSTYHASSLVLTAYFLGTGLGAWYFGRKGIRKTANAAFPAKLLAALLFSFFLLSCVPSAFIGLVFAALFPACFFMGGFFPLIAQVSGRVRLVLLYGINALGALFGTLAGSFLVPRALGYSADFWMAAVVMVSGLVLLYPCLKKEAGPKDPGPEAELPGSFLGLSFCSGFLTILLEVVWIKQIAAGTDNTVYAFGSAGILMLIMMGAAALFAAKAPQAWFARKTFLIITLALASSGVLVSAVLFVRLTGGLKTVVIGRTYGFWEAMGFSARFLLPAMAFTLLIFPLLIRHINVSQEARGKSFGRFFAVNSLGCGLGAFLGGMVFPGVLGMWGSLLVCALGYAIMPFLLERSRLSAACAVACAVVIFTVNLTGFPKITPDPISAGFDGPARLAWAKEGPYGTVSVIDFGDKRTLWLNSSYVLGGSRSVQDDRRLGLLPCLLSPGAKSAAFIGIATGISASGLLNTELEKITLIELVPEVRTAAEKFFGDVNRGLFADPRVRAVVDDGRGFFRFSADTYDIVISDLFVPWHEGTSFLYTREHFRNVRAHLNPGGRFFLWLPAYELTEREFGVIVKTFLSVFPDATLWQNNFAAHAPVLGLAGGAPLDTAAIARHIEARGQRKENDFTERHPAGLFMRYLGPLGGEFPGPETLPLNTLDRPAIEFMSAAPRREFLTGRRYLDFAARRVNTAPDQWTNERRAGLHLLESVHYLRQGDRERAYRAFDAYKALVPEVLRQP